ncbi:MAG: hypothetical protein WD928_01990 [Gammaproteobacteria bacterium]
MSEHDRPSAVLGESAACLDIDDNAQLVEVSLELARQCSRYLDIVSRHLDPALYDNDEFCDAVKSLALGNRHARIRLFIIDSRPLVRRGHRLIDLAIRLPSFIHVRGPSPQHREFNEAMLVADRVGYVHRRFADRPEARADFYDRRSSSALIDRIDELWERGSPDPNFRRLHI